MEETKERTISLSKSQVHYDIDALTYQLTESMMQASDPKARNAVASDQNDTYNKSVLTRLTDYRDATLRRKLLFCLKEEEEVESFSNDLDTDSDYVYTIVVPASFKGLKSLGMKMHEYLVKGGLLDWYIQSGVTVSTAALADQVNALESEIVCMLRVPSSVKKPLQPFGPARVI